MIQERLDKKELTSLERLQELRYSYYEELEQQLRKLIKRKKELIFNYQKECVDIDKQILILKQKEKLIKVYNEKRTKTKK